MYEVNNLEDLQNEVTLVDGYMIAVTLLKGDKLYHSLFRKDFPTDQMLKSLKRQKELAIELQETDTLPEY
jgi:hypothetical protein